MEICFLLFKSTFASKESHKKFCVCAVRYEIIMPQIAVSFRGWLEVEVQIYDFLCFKLREGNGFWESGKKSDRDT